MNEKHKILEWNEVNFKFYLTPGHSPGSMSIQIDNYLFSGDTIITMVKPSANPPDSNKQILSRSVDFVLNYFPRNTIILPGHGKYISLEEYKKEFVKTEKGFT